MFLLTELAGWHCRHPLVVSNVLDPRLPVQGVPCVTLNGDKIPHRVGGFLSLCHSPITYDWCGTRLFRLFRLFRFTWKKKKGGKKKKTIKNVLLHQTFKICQSAVGFSSFTHRYSAVKHPRSFGLGRWLSSVQSHQGRSSQHCSGSAQTPLSHRQVWLESGPRWGSLGQDTHLE